MSRNRTDKELDNLNDTLGLNIREAITRLHQIKTGSKIYEKVGLDGQDMKERVIIFHRTDGMYSYCTIQELDGETVLQDDGTKALIHLSVTTPLVAYKDGYRIYKGKLS